MKLSSHQNIIGSIYSTIQSNKRYLYLLGLSLGYLSIALITGCLTDAKTNQSTTPTNEKVSSTPTTTVPCNQNTAETITAEVVAVEQIITFNRFGAFNPAGMVFALKKDVVYDNPDTKEKVEQLSLPNAVQLDDPKFAKKIAGFVSLRKDKRPRPLVLRVNECDYLQVKFWNLLSPEQSVHSKFIRSDFPDGGVQRHAVQESPIDNPTKPNDPKAEDISSPPRCRDDKGNQVSNAANCKNLFPFPRQEDPDYPSTRAASIHVNGLEYANIEADGANVGENPSSLAEPGTSKTYTWYARQEGGYFFYSDGALAGGEGDGGQLGLGLFGSVNVEPLGSIWYRSQVTHDELASAKVSKANPLYNDLRYNNLAILEGNQIAHSDLNAIIYQPNTKSKDGNLRESGMDCSKQSPGSSCGMSFREFTTIFHDENKVFQAFAELSDENNPVSAVADGMAINYGASGVGSAVLAAKKKIGPAKDCPDCKLEEFFLSSWVNGDPAMIVRRDMDGKAVEALYPDDPSNVHHSYLGDPVRFRNIHAGPKETHVFHLHAHQWLQDKNDPNANYLDSQTISPGSSYTYDIQYGGGNRNLTVGDAIFHCHLYPHFAAGMWELWRNHDVFEDGKPGLFATNNPGGRYLPDYEIKTGTPNPAIIPIPGYPLAPSPTADMRGYPFYIAAEKGHRPPQPPLDMARDKNNKELNGGLPRHIITGGDIYKKDEPEMHPDVLLDEVGSREETKAARYIAKRTWKLANNDKNLSLAAKLKTANIELKPQCGSKEEILAMAFHAGWSKNDLDKLKAGNHSELPSWCTEEVKKTLNGYDTSKWIYQSETDPNWPYRKVNNIAMKTLWEAKGYKTSKNPANATAYDPGHLFRINGYAPAQGAPFAEPCPSGYYDDEGDYPPSDPHKPNPYKFNRKDPRKYKAAYIQFDMTVNKYGWHDPQARMPVLEEDAADTISGVRLAEPLFFRANSGDCIQFQATNLIPSVLNLDDFQVYTPTDAYPSG